MTSQPPFVRPHRHPVGAHRCAQCQRALTAIGRAETYRPSLRRLDPEMAAIFDPETPQELLAARMSGLMALSLGPLDRGSPFVTTLAR